MKNSPSSLRPRLICRAIRAARVFSDRAGGDHLDGCVDCQAFFRPAEQFEFELRREASARRHAAVEPATELERSILRAVREERAAAPRAVVEKRSPSPLWSLGAVAAAAIVALVYFQRPATSLSHPAVPDDAVAVVDAVEDLSVKITDTVIPEAGAMVANNPLQRELGSVYTDARSALNFLALNFLPSGAAAPSGKPGSAI